MHKLFQAVLSCAVCAQILMSSSGKPRRVLFACETKFLRRPVFICDRPFAKPKRVCRASRVGAIRATCPNHLVYLRPTKTLQSGTPNICKHLSFVMRWSRIRTQEIPSMSRIFSYQNLLMSRHRAKTHFSAFFEIYKICNPSHCSDLKISAKYRQTSSY